MITIKTLSENFSEVLSSVKEALADHYTGILDEYAHAPYGIDATAVYQDGCLLDVKIFDPYQKLSSGIYINANGHSSWLMSYCDNEELMLEGGLSEDEIEEIESL